MYFAVTKIVFESDGRLDTDYREITSLAVKLQTKFKVSVQVSHSFKEDGIPMLVIASLGKTENHISRQIDRMVEYCELSGFGRVGSERTLLDHIDSI